MSNDTPRIAQDINEIKGDIREIKADLSEHMSRTAANEARIELMEEFTKQAMTNQQENFKAMLQSNKDNQAALNRQLKIALGVFAALASLIGAFAAFVK
jgi:biotin-(acetyl-CoA carboxylase) ligase